MADLVATTGTAVCLCAGVGLTFINIRSVVVVTSESVLVRRVSTDKLRFFNDITSASSPVPVPAKLALNLSH